MSKAPKNHLPFSPHPAMGQVAGVSRRVCLAYPSASDLALVTEDMSQLGHVQPQINSSRAPWLTKELSHFKPTCVLWKVTAAASSWRFCHLATLLLPLGSGRCCVSFLFHHQEKAQNNNNNTNNNTSNNNNNNNNNNTALHSASTRHYQHSHNKLQHR